MTDFANRIEQIFEQLILCSSENRAVAMIVALRDQPPGVVWPVFLENFSICADTWAHQRALLALLCGAPPGAHAYMSAEAKNLFANLPDMVIVFRGCSRERVRGLSWTLDREVAKGFAHGHRFIPVHDPVVAKALIPKAAIFALITDRKEAEVILDPALLENVTSSQVVQ